LLLRANLDLLPKKGFELEELSDMAVFEVQSETSLDYDPYASTGAKLEQLLAHAPADVTWSIADGSAKNISRRLRAHLPAVEQYLYPFSLKDLRSSEAAVILNTLLDGRKSKSPTSYQSTAEA